MAAIVKDRNETTAIDPLADWFPVDKISADESQKVNANNIIRAVAGGGNENASSILTGFMTPALFDKLGAWGGFGAMNVIDGTTEQTGIGTTAVQLTPFTTNMVGNQQCTPDQANNRIQLDAAGIWLMLCGLSLSDSGNTDFICRLRCNGDGSVFGGAAELQLTNTGIASECLLAIVTGVSVNDTIDVTIEADGAGKSTTVSEATMIALRLA